MEKLRCSDDEACLENLTNDLPSKARHILDWSHIAMKVQALAQLARTVPSDVEAFGAEIASVKWQRLWHGQADRALDLMQLSGYLNYGSSSNSVAKAV